MAIANKSKPAPKTEIMRISFVIPARNEEENIGPTIESILKQPSDLVKEIIVVDNGSTDATAKIASSFSGVKVLSEPTPGTNRARQKGLDAATGEIIAFIDADNWVTPGWSEKVIKYLEKAGVVGVSGPYWHRDQNAIGKFLTYWGFLIIAYPIYFLVHYLLKRGGIVLGGNLAAKRDALLEVGGLDTNFTFFGDDANTGRRLRKIGKVIFAPRLITLASARRFQKHGYIKTTFKYFINYIWVILFNKPFTK